MGKVVQFALTVGLVGVVGCTRDVVERPEEWPQQDTSQGADAFEVSDAPDAFDASTSDGGEADTGGDRGDSGRPDGTSREVDTGSACAPQGDADGDGLNDCEEQKVLCTSPYEKDTDGDGLTDYDEIAQGSDPCEADSDGDGLDDGEEHELGFDPNDTDSDGDGTEDRDEWIVDACQTTTPATTALDANLQGNWWISLEPAFKGATTLKIAGSAANDGALLYGDSSTGVVGALVSREPVEGVEGPSDVLFDEVTQALEARGTLKRDTVGSEFQTHDRHTAAIGRFVLKTETETTAGALREALVGELARFSASDVGNWPSTGGESHREFRVVAAVILRVIDPRKPDSPVERRHVAMAVVPERTYQVKPAAKVQVDDLTNTTNVAEKGGVMKERCVRYRAGEGGSARRRMVLPHTAASSTLRVWLAGGEVPRFRKEGFAYFAETNAIGFSGTSYELWSTSTFRPFAVIRYRTFE